jgi:hypothetical protein
VPDLLAVVRGLLPGLSGRWRHLAPSTRKALALKDVADDGTLLPAKGRPRAVLRLPPEGLDGTGGATVAALTRLAAAINAGAGRATLLAWGKPHTLAGQLEDRQRRVAALPPGSGRHALAVSQAAHLAAMVAGRPSTPDRPARGPVRRHGFYLVVEGRDAAELRRTVDDLCALYGAVRCAGPEAAAVEADVWRGLPLPPRIQFWKSAADAPDVELYLNDEGAHIRRVDPATGRKLEQLFP